MIYIDFNYLMLQKVLFIAYSSNTYEWYKLSRKNKMIVVLLFYVILVQKTFVLSIPSN